MAEIRVELLLVVLTGTLLLVSVRGWTPIDESQLLSLYETGQMGQSQSITTSTTESTAGDDSDYDNGEDPDEVGQDSEIVGAATATSDNADPFAEHGIQVDENDFGPGNWDSSTDDGLQVEYVDVPPRSWDDSTESGFQVEFDDAPPRTWVSGTDDGFQVEFDDAPPINWASATAGGFQVDSEDPPPRNWASGTDGGFQVNSEDPPPRNWASGTDGGFQVEFDDAPPRSIPSSTAQKSELDVVCSEFGLQITLPEGPLDQIKVWGSKNLLPVKDDKSCGFDLNPLRNTLTVLFTGCNVKHEENCHTNRYSLQLLYVDKSGKTKVATASCEMKKDTAVSSLFPRSSTDPSKCPKPTQPPPSNAQNCAVPTEERVTCGQSGISSSDCEMMGCCVDSSTNACYYPMDECTADQHFVFAIRQNSASLTVDPTKLVLPGNPKCKPVIVNDRFAIFKFKVTECGTRVYTVGETKIYLAEVQSIVQARRLKHGIITSSNPLRFMVECRYGKSGSTKGPLATIGFMVKTPTSILPSAIISRGLYGVQLRIAKDETFSGYLPTNNQPLKLLLGNPVYLELRLKSPKPDAVILVNYCIAYPRSAKNALVLVYDGCGNPYDQSTSILQVSDLPKNRYQRRFVVKAFQFMDQKTNKYLDEEIYFMCSTEVCSPREKNCAERCFDGKKP